MGEGELKDDGWPILVCSFEPRKRAAQFDKCSLLSLLANELFNLSRKLKILDFAIIGKGLMITFCW